MLINKQKEVTTIRKVDTKFLTILTILGTLAFCVGMLSGFDRQQAVAELKPTVAKNATTETVKQSAKIAQSKLDYIGEFTLTGYTDNKACCGKDKQPTATGTKPTAGRTIGTDWTTLKPGTRVYIEGIGYRVVEDKVATWISQKYGGKIIDLFMSDYEVAKAIGWQTVKVYKIIE